MSSKSDFDMDGDADHDERGMPEDGERRRKHNLTRKVLLKLDTR